MEPGDVVVTNHPRFGGSHLPDVTVVTPAHSDSGELLGYVASRAHHAEIGGVRPGSMPPAATRLAEEGVVIPPTYLVRGGQARWEAVRRTPARTPPTRAAAPRTTSPTCGRRSPPTTVGAVALADSAAEHGATRSGG